MLFICLRTAAFLSPWRLRLEINFPPDLGCAGLGQAMSLCPVGLFWKATSRQNRHSGKLHTEQFVFFNWLQSCQSRKHHKCWARMFGASLVQCNLHKGSFCSASYAEKAMHALRISSIHQVSPILHGLKQVCLESPWDSEIKAGQMCFPFREREREHH